MIKKILLSVLLFGFLTIGKAQDNNNNDKKESMSQKIDLPEYLQYPSEEERVQFFKNLKSDQLSKDEFGIISNTKVNGVSYTAVYSKDKFSLASIAAVKYITDDGKKLNRQVFLYHDKNKIPDVKDLGIEKNRINNGLMGLVRQTSKGKMFIKMYIPEKGFIDANW